MLMQSPKSYGPEENLSSVAISKISNVDYGAREDVDDPFVVFDLGEVIFKYRQWTKMMPRVHPYYAVKCNPNEVLLRLLSGLGANFDCASKGEIQKILSLGVSPDRIIYAHPVKQMSHIQFASNHEVKLMTFDNPEELRKVKTTCPDARLVIRFRYDEKTSELKLGGKFGCHEDDGSYLLQLAKDLGLSVVGTCFNLGSSPEDPMGFYNAIRHVHFAYKLGRSLGHPMTLLDLGGGIEGRLEPHLFQKFADAINLALDEFFPVGCGIDVIAEPGQYLVASSAVLLASVVGKSQVTKDDRKLIECADNPDHRIRGGSTINQLYLNVGLYNAYDPVHHLYQLIDGPPVPIKGYQGRQLVPTRLFGPTLAVLDCIFEECLMPDLDISEWVLFKNFGAYRCSTAGLSFNGFRRPDMFFTFPETELSVIERIFGTEETAENPTTSTSLS